MAGRRKPPAKKPQVPQKRPTTIPDDFSETSTAHQQGKVLAFRGQRFSGPLPHPDLIAQYNDVIPNGADRIVSMAERQAEHRQFLEKTTVLSDRNRAYLGMILGFCIVLFFGGCGAYLITNGNEIKGFIALFGPLASLVGTFFYSERARRRERLERSRVRGEALPPE
jgi:uncharacterized membrane protein